MNKSSAVAEMGNRGHNRHGLKRGGEGAAVPLSEGGALTACLNTMWHGPRPTFVPSGILINSAIWPQ